MFYAYKTQSAEGICTTWSECQEKTKGVSGAKFKKFASYEDAQAFLNQLNTAVHSTITENADIPLGHAVLYVDGSYNAITNQYGYGIYCTDSYGYWTAKGSGRCLYGGRNVEGEVAAAHKAVKYILDNKLYSSIVIYHDYEGVGAWANHQWRANTPYTIDYAHFIDEARKTLQINFIHVNGHTGNLGNEIVDKLAKIACDVLPNRDDRTFMEKYQNELQDNEVEV